MTLPQDLSPALSLSLELSQWQQLGLAFLLGSFAVATLSDLRRLSAQSEFREIWVLFVAAALCHDLYKFHFDEVSGTVVALKWGLILVLSLLARVSGLAIGDVAAMAATAALLSPALVVIFYVEAKVLSLVAEKTVFRGRKAWPFMPVVSLSTLGILFLGFRAANDLWK
jgi:prepilin signal peptidase PulO-like enzyme (type II secretory pathway)